MWLLTITAVLGFMMVYGEQIKHHYNLQTSCLLSPEAVSNLTLETLDNINGDMNCARLCSRHENCSALIHANSSCVLLEDPGSHSCANVPNNGVVYYSRESEPEADSGSSSALDFTCNVSAVGNPGGGFPFNMSDMYNLNKSPISQVQVYYDPSWQQGQHLRGIKVTWEAGDLYVTGSTIGSDVGTCDLAPGEFIYKVEYSVVAWDAWNDVMGPVSFTTNQKTCGPYGFGTPTDVLQGDKLLYFAGSSATAIDSLFPHFQSCF